MGVSTRAVCSQHTHGTYYERPQVRRLDPDLSALLRLDDLLHLYNLVLGLLFLFQNPESRIQTHPPPRRLRLLPGSYGHPIYAAMGSTASPTTLASSTSGLYKGTFVLVVYLSAPESSLG